MFMFVPLTVYFCCHSRICDIYCTFYLCTACIIIFPYVYMVISMLMIIIIYGKFFLHFLTAGKSVFFTTDWVRMRGWDGSSSGPPQCRIVNDLNHTYTHLPVYVILYWIKCSKRINSLQCHLLSLGGTVDRGNVLTDAHFAITLQRSQPVHFEPPQQKLLPSPIHC